jgi:membrane-bound serine protease (ClpP class)
MEVFITPDAGYALLMLSVLFTVMALLSPGSGLYEAAALALILSSGYILAQLPLNTWFFVVIILAIYPFYASVWKGWHPGFLALSIGMLLIGCAFLFKGETWYPPLNPILILCASILEGGILWFGTHKTMEVSKHRPVQDLQKLIHAIGEAKTAVHHEGTIQVDSELWSARSENPIPRGRRVRVLRRDGLILTVQEVDKIQP